MDRQIIDSSRIANELTDSKIKQGGGGMIFKVGESDVSCCENREETELERTYSKGPH